MTQGVETRAQQVEIVHSEGAAKSRTPTRGLGVGQEVIHGGPTLSRSFTPLGRGGARGERASAAVCTKLVVLHPLGAPINAAGCRRLGTPRELRTGLPYEWGSSSKDLLPGGKFTRWRDGHPTKGCRARDPDEPE
jgi:hypothetical protein